MSRYNLTDLQLTADGDLALSPAGDLGLVDRLAYQAQQAACRIKSIAMDWCYDNVGADLEDLLGRENSPETADAFKQLVTSALTADGFLDEQDLYMEVVPVSREKLVMFLFLNSPHATEPLGFEVELDLAAGAAIRPV